MSASEGGGGNTQLHGQQILGQGIQATAFHEIISLAKKRVGESCHYKL